MSVPPSIELNNGATPSLPLPTAALGPLAALASPSSDRPSSRADSASGGGSTYVTIHVKPVTPRPAAEEERAASSRAPPIRIHTADEGSAEDAAAPQPWDSLSPVSRISSTLRRMPSSYHRMSLSLLPSDLLVHVCTMLSTADLCRLSATCTRVREVTSRPQVWRPRCAFLAHIDAPDAPAVVDMLADEPTLKAKWIRYRRWQLRRIRSEHAAAVKSYRQRKSMCCLHTMDGSMFCLLIGIMVLVGGTTLLRHLESPRASGPLTGASLWPFACMLVYIVLVTSCLCLARCDRSRARCCHPEVTTPATEEVQMGGMVRFIMREVLRDEPGLLLLFYIMLLLFAATAILIAVRACGASTMAYAYAFIPLWCLFLLLAALPQYPLVRAMPCLERWGTCQLIWLVLIGPMCTFSALVCARLSRTDVGVVAGPDSGGLSWMVVMVPLFLLDFYLLCTCLYAAWEDRTGSPLAIYVGLLGPWITFKVMLAYWLDNGGDDGPLSIGQVFIPFWIHSSYIIFGALGSCATTQPTAQLSVLLEPRPMREPLVL